MAVVVFGARSLARVLLELMDRAGICPIAGLVDDDPQLHGTKVDGIPVLGSVERVAPLIRVHRIHRAVIAVMDNPSRRRLAEYARSLGLRLPVLIHPAAVVSPTAHLSDGTVVMAGAIIGAHAHVGELGIINTRAVVDHDCMLGDHVHVGQGATLAGNVTVGNEVLIGAGATLIPDICVGDEAVVGAGAAVLHDVASRTTVVGCPARPLPGRTGTGTPESLSSTV